LVSAVVLAAGAATRYGSPKQRVFLPYVLERLAATSVGEVVVVEGAHPLEETETLSLAGVRVVRCPEWALGPGASLRCGLSALGEDVEAALVVLADGPQLDPRAVERLIERRHDADVVVASYDGTRDHPAVLSRAAWSSIPDEGARALEATLVPCDDLEPPGDMDYPGLWQPPGDRPD
jgi:nicotine blue oxidoreductase